MIDDRRTKDTRKVEDVELWVVATDKFMSGWGRAMGRSLVAYPADLCMHEQKKRLIEWMESRLDFLRVRENMNLPRLGAADHLAIYDAYE